MDIVDGSCLRSSVGIQLMQRVPLTTMTGQRSLAETYAKEVVSEVV